MSTADELNAEYWRSIAYCVLNYAPIELRKVIDDMGAVPPEESIRKLRTWNDAAGHHLQVQAANEFFRTAYWRH